LETERQTPRRSAWPAGHAQVPLWHVSPPLQSASMQQSLFGMQLVPHTFSFAGHWQALPLHVWPVTVHSDVRQHCALVMHAPPHRRCVAGHAQLPP
jgi:hypothetical protein